MKSMEPELEVGPERKGGVEPGSPRNQGQSSPAQTRLEVVHTSRLEDLGCCLCSVSGRATASVSHQHDGQDHASTVGQGRGTTVGLAICSRTRGNTLSQSVHAWRHRSAGARSAQRKETVSEQGDVVRDQTHQELE
jgi:hypothetical protein